jgi:hypothetical protein
MSLFSGFVQTSNRTFVIGDVHGCLYELQQLWAQLPLTPDSEIIFLGDLIDKGPDSDGVLAFVRARQREYRVVIVVGNHELKALRRVARGLAVEFTPQADNLALLQSALPYYPFWAGLAVHAGVFPAFLRQYPVLPDLAHAEHWPPRLRERLKRLTFCRFVNPHGQTVVLGQEQPEDRFWAEVYTGHFGQIFFGHQPWLNGVRLFPHAVGLDTGCVYGGTLSAACLEPNQPLRFFQVPAAQRWAEPLVDGMELSGTPNGPA